MSTDSERVDGAGLSRRQVLARGAVATGLVWAAPVIRTTAAYASTGGGTARPCKNFFLVALDQLGCRAPLVLQGRQSVALHDLDSLTQQEVADLLSDLSPSIRQWFNDNPYVSVSSPDTCPIVSQTSELGWAVLLPEVTGPNAANRQCRFIIGSGVQAQTYVEGSLDPAPPIPAEAGRRVIFPCPDTSGGGSLNAAGRQLQTADNPPGTHVGALPDLNPTTTTTTTPDTTTTTIPQTGSQAARVGVGGAPAPVVGGGTVSGGTPIVPSATTTTSTTTAPRVGSAQQPPSGGRNLSTGDVGVTPAVTDCLDYVVLIFCCPE